VGPARRSRSSAKKNDAFKTFVLDQLDGLDVVAKAMFGGVGLYSRGVFFGIIARDTLYLKVGDANRRDYENVDAPAFEPYPGRSKSRNYYAVPVDVLESAHDLTAWARKAIAVAAAK
jgi:DNA transformation protein